MYCSQCGLSNWDDAKFCAGCGMSIGKGTMQDIPVGAYFGNAPQARSGEGGVFWWGLLSVLIPIVGIVLFLCWRNKYPRRAKVCLWCGVISMAINFFAAPYIADLSFSLASNLYFSFL
jgi:hypothetical protein